MSGRSSGVSDQQSVGASPGCGTYVIEQYIIPQLLLYPSDGTLEAEGTMHAHMSKQYMEEYGGKHRCFLFTSKHAR